MTERSKDLKNVGRRSMLKILGAGALSVPALGNASAASRSGQLTTIELDGTSSGWVVRSDNSNYVVGKGPNPVFTFREGQRYRVSLHNQDGNAHNFVIRGSSGEPLIQTDDVTEQGTEQTVEFTASEEMEEYRCRTCSNMTGEIRVQESLGELSELAGSGEGDFDVMSVKPGHNTEESWEPAGMHVDVESSFDVRIAVRNIGTSAGEVALAYMVAIADPNGGFQAVHGSQIAQEFSGSNGEIIHGRPDNHAFWPDKHGPTWPKGSYRIFASVTDRNQNAFAGGISNPFIIS